MTIYESNYLKFDSLVGGRLPADTQSISSAADDCDLYLEILRREPYTSTLKLTYWFDEKNKARTPDPDLLVRVYHDASLVEAVSAGGRASLKHPVLKALAEYHSGELDRRWRINIMLNKWLDYLLEMGHEFA